MTRTELLSLAAELSAYGATFDDGPGMFGEAAAILRKLAELRPVAWRLEWDETEGACSWVEHYDESDPAPSKWDSDPPSRTLKLYQLSEVLTDE